MGSLGFKVILVFSQWEIDILLLNMAIEIVDLHINSMVIFHSYVNVYQRVNPLTLLLLMTSSFCSF